MAENNDNKDINYDGPVDGSGSKEIIKPPELSFLQSLFIRTEVL